MMALHLHFEHMFINNDKMIVKQIKKEVNMPRGDRTGPLGQGPMTGRGMGDCANGERTGWFRHGFGRGFGTGRGFGRGAGRGFGWGVSQAPYDKETEKSWLDAAITGLKNQLKSLEKQRNEFEE